LLRIIPVSPDAAQQPQPDSWVPSASNNSALQRGVAATTLAEKVDHMQNVVHQLKWSKRP
jgi:hypothetical protein